MSLLDTLLDPENRENIELYSADGEAVEFEQIAVIPQEDKVFFILHPIVPFDGMKADQALVFFIEEDDEDRLILCENDEEITGVFDVYFQMLRDAGVQTDDE